MERTSSTGEDTTVSQIDKSTVRNALRAKADDLGYPEAKAAVEELIAYLELEEKVIMVTVRVTQQIAEEAGYDWEELLGDPEIDELVDIILNVSTDDLLVGAEAQVVDVGVHDTVL